RRNALRARVAEGSGVFLKGRRPRVSSSLARSPLLGCWEVTISTPGHPEWTTEFHGLIAMTSDGISISSDATDISIGLGSWQAGPNNTFSLNRRSNFIDPTGVVSVLHTVHHGSLTSPTTFKAIGVGYMYEPDGTTLMYEIPNVHLVGKRY
ncbi:MAG TPA: hypothetical protein VF755_10265, partial [Catenuloplanes sp.]